MTYKALWAHLAPVALSAIGIAAGVAGWIASSQNDAIDRVDTKVDMLLNRALHNQPAGIRTGDQSTRVGVHVPDEPIAPELMLKDELTAAEVSRIITATGGKANADTVRRRTREGTLDEICGGLSPEWRKDSSGSYRYANVWRARSVHETSTKRAHNVHGMTEVQ